MNERMKHSSNQEYLLRVCNDDDDNDIRGHDSLLWLPLQNIMDWVA